MDFIDLALALGYSHCLITVYLVSGWNKYYPSRRVDATTVVKRLITEIISQFGIPLWIE